MNKVVIKSIEIKNFKGIASFKTEFDPKLTKFYGCNGSGKSTIKNAWEWALCRNVSDYLPNLNNKEVPNLVTSVEVVLLVNDLEYILKRESKPKYKDGEKVGNEAKYSIDTL
ncbi:MAG: AAA family ATPase, partial [Acetobacter sp.]|nr:AAA family ATPase [Acetobacter sp.]